MPKLVIVSAHGCPACVNSKSSFERLKARYGDLCEIVEMKRMKSKVDEVKGLPTVPDVEKFPTVYKYSSSKNKWKEFNMDKRDKNSTLFDAVCQWFEKK